MAHERVRKPETEAGPGDSAVRRGAPAAVVRQAVVRILWPDSAGAARTGGAVRVREALVVAAFRPRVTSEVAAAVQAINAVRVAPTAIVRIADGGRTHAILVAHADSTRIDRQRGIRRRVRISASRIELRRIHAWCRRGPAATTAERQRGESEADGNRSARRHRLTASALSADELTTAPPRSPGSQKPQLTDAQCQLGSGGPPSVLSEGPRVQNSPGRQSASV